MTPAPEPVPLVRVATGEVPEAAAGGAPGVPDTRQLAHDLLRGLAAELIGCEPGDVRVGHDAAGRPVIDHPSAGRLRCSLAHAGRIAAAAVATGCAVGVDVEPVDARRADLATVSRFLDEATAAALGALAADARPREVALAWTRLEAEAKGRGISLDRLRGRARSGWATALALGPAHVGTVWTDREARVREGAPSAP